MLTTGHELGSAQFDATGTYRYSLHRRWAAAGPNVAFIMLNPSRADAQQDDPTLRACTQFAQRWQYGSLTVVNLFAYRTPHPRLLKTAAAPIGPENDRYLLAAAQAADRIVLAWGNEGGLWERDRAVLNLLLTHHQKLFCLSRNRTGHPRHPLYVRRDTTPTRFTPQPDHPITLPTTHHRPQNPLPQ